jgi:hypothetical protein
MLSPTERSLRARIGAYELHAQYDPVETTAKARQTFLARFLDQVDPDQSLPEAERQRRAVAARKAHFARLALKSARSRSKGKRKATVADAVAISETIEEVGDAAPPPSR